jgi:cation diffusion facilitator family transporter
MSTASAFSGAAADARVLLVSVWASAGFAVVSLVWGLFAGSQMIVFDGLYSFASVLLSLLAVLAARTAARGPDERYPWGREVWEPVTIVVKAAALGALSVYALIGGIVEILDGGRSVAAGWAVAYAVIATGGGVAASWYLRRRSRRGSDLIRAEAAEWVSDTLLSFGVLVGFVVALVLERTGRSDLARYVDPVMVALISAAFLPVPARLATRGLREILTMAPGPDLRGRLADHVAEVEREYGFSESYLRTSKVGSRLDVEIDFVVPETARAQCVRDFDVVRADLHERLHRLAPVTAMTVSFTADPRWAR